MFLLLVSLLSLWKPLGEWWITTLSSTPACHGHTILTWTHSGQDAKFFEIRRRIHGLVAWTVVGDTLFCNRNEYTDDDGYHPAILCKDWPLLRAYSIPLEGIVYDYQVRTVSPTGAVSVWSPTVVCDPQDPTTCYEDGLVVLCP